MNTPRYIHEIAIPAAYKLLPEKMHGTDGTALVLAAGLQESKFIYRRQTPEGPARSFFQFEPIGVKGVLVHPSTRAHITQVLKTMGYDARILTSHEAIEHNDVLACVYARLLLWSSPMALPTRAEASEAWLYYLLCWRPGKPHRETWDAFYKQAWAIAEPL